MAGGHGIVGVDFAFGREEADEMSLVGLCFLEDI